MEFNFHIKKVVKGALPGDWEVEGVDDPSETRGGIEEIAVRCCVFDYVSRNWFLIIAIDREIEGRSIRLSLRQFSYDKEKLINLEKGMRLYYTAISPIRKEDNYLLETDAQKGKANIYSFLDKIIGLDFDGTCVTHDFPEIGEELPNCISVLKRIQSVGGKIVLNTMRSDRADRAYLTEAVNWLTERGIVLYGINENPTQKQWTESPKVYAHIYIDDAALGIPLYQHKGHSRPAVCWYTVERLMFK